MSREVMQQALDALEWLLPADAFKVGEQWLCQQEGVAMDVSGGAKGFAAIAALRAALAEKPAAPAALTDAEIEATGGEG